MSFFSASLLLAAALAVPVTQPQAPSCPATQAAHPLVSVDVFDGPPTQRADLVPDYSHRTTHGAVASWNVASTYTAGRHIFLVCTYRHPAPPGTRENPANVPRCLFRPPPPRLAGR